MTDGYTSPVGTPCWIDLGTSDVQKSIEFYGKVFGWTAVDQGEDYAHYHLFSLGDQLVAGMMAADPAAGQPDGWATYLSTSDIDATIAASTAAGATTFFAAMPVMDLGKMAIVADPSGATVGVWEPENHVGFGAHGISNAPVWHELHTQNYPAALSYYRDVFGWTFETLSDTDEFRYARMEIEGVPYAGVLDGSGWMPQAGLPSSWEVYFGVEDTDAAVASAVALGGTVIEAAVDTPFGRLATITDSTGARIKITDRAEIQ